MIYLICFNDLGPIVKQDVKIDLYGQRWFHLKITSYDRFRKKHHAAQDIESLDF